MKKKKNFLGKVGKIKQLSVTYSKVRNNRIRYFQGEKGGEDLYKSTNENLTIKCVLNMYNRHEPTCHKTEILSTPIHSIIISY